VGRKLKVEPKIIEGSEEEITRKFFQSFAGGGLSYIEESYRKDKNPLLAWEAYLYARENKKPIPGWVLEYLDASAQRLFEKIPRKNASNHIASAFGMYSQGKGNVFRRFFGFKERCKVVLSIMQKIQEDKKMNLSQICGDIASELEKTGRLVSNVTVEKWYKELRNTLRPTRFVLKSPQP
jgi:hypothetical protein